MYRRKKIKVDYKHIEIVDVLWDKIRKLAFNHDCTQRDVASMAIAYVLCDKQHEEALIALIQANGLLELLTRMKENGKV